MTAQQPRQLAMPDAPQFDGADYRPVLDHPRVLSGYQRVVALMADNRWRTLAEISARTGVPEASVSAHLRSLRKPRFGAHILEKERMPHGQYHYRVLFTSSASDFFSRGISR